MNEKDIINWRNLSIFITGSPYLIRKDRTPARYVDDVQKVESRLKRVLKELAKNRL